MMKKLIAMVLTAAMLLSLLVVPAGADLVDGTATLSITPDVTSVKSTGEDVKVTYTIKVTPPEGKSVGEFHFTLSAPEGMTLASDDEGYSLANELFYHSTFSKDGIFETFAYTPASHYFQASGTTDTRNLTNEATVMTIEATITAGAVGDYTLTATGVGINPDGTNKYTVNVSTTPVSVYSELNDAAVTGLTAPVKGGAPDGEVSSSDHTSATVAWFLGENAVTGNFAASTQYTAQITVTPDAGYRFADGASFTVDDTSDWVVTDGQNGAKVLTKTFPATADRSLLSISVTTAPKKTAYKVGDNFDATGMVVSAHYDEGEDDTNYSNYTVLGGTELQLGTASVTIASKENNSITTTQAITVSRKNLTGDDFEYTNGTVTYDGNDHASTARNIQGFKEGLMGSLTFIFKVGDNVVQELINAGVYTVYVSTEEGTMYNAMGQTEVGTFTINQADNSISNLTIDGWTYGEQAKDPSATAAFGTVAYTYSNAENGTFTSDVPTDAGTWYVKASVAATENYAAAEAVASFTIARAQVFVTADNAQKEFGQSDPDQFTATVDGLLGQDTISYTVSRAPGSDVGTYTITPAGDATQGNYNVSYVTGTFTISQADNSISNLTIDGWTYGEQAKEPSATAAFGTVAYTYSNAENGTFTPDVPTDAGTWYVKATVAETTNYKGAEAVTSFIIAPKTVDVSALTWDYTKALTYNGQAQTVTLAGDLPEGVTADYSNNTKQFVGDYEAGVTLSPENGNYQVTGSVANLNWSIVAAAQNPTVEASRSLAKGGNTLDLTTLVSGNQGDLSFEIVSGDEYATLSGTTLTSGTTTGSVVITVKAAAKDDGGDSKVEYSAYERESAITVTVVDKEQKELTVTMGGWTYGDNAKSPAFTAPAGSAAPVITYTGENYSSATAPTNAGTYTVQVVCETATEIHTGTAEFTIAPRTAAITWSNTSFPYDGQSHVPTATVSNKVGQDSVSVTVSGAASDAGSHTATATGLDNTNYVLPATAPTRSFTIDKRVAELEWNNTTFTYDGQRHVPTATVTNAVGDDTVTVTVTGGQTNAGSYTATATKVSNSNYALPDGAACDFTIAPKNISDMTVNLSAAALTYNGKAQTKAVASVRDGSTTLYSGRDYTVSGATQTNAGHYELTVTGTGNYTGSKTVAWEIAPKAVTVTANNATKVYGADDPTLTAKVSGTVGSDTVEYTVSRAEGNNVGTYAITPAGAENQGNYTVTFKTGTFTITKANASVTSAPQAFTDLVFNGTDQKLITAGQAEGGELQYKLGNGAYSTDIPEATEAGNYTVYYMVVGDKNHNNVSEARITVTIAPLSGNDVVTSGDVTASTEPDDTINQLSGVEQFTDAVVGITEQDSPAEKQEKREAAVKNALVSAAGTSATNASALYYVVNTGSSAAKVTFALPALASTHNFKVMYMAANGAISQVTNAKVTASGIEVPVAADGDGVYLVTYTNKPIPVVIHDDDTVKSAGTGDMGLVLYTVLAVSGATGAAWLGLKKRKED